MSFEIATSMMAPVFRSIRVPETIDGRLLTLARGVLVKAHHAKAARHVSA